MTLLASHLHDAFANATVFEWILFVSSAVATVALLAYAVRLTLHPREDDPGHVKYTILEDDRPKGAVRTTMP